MSFANSTIIKDHLLADIDRLVRLNLDSWTGRILLMDEAKKLAGINAVVYYSTSVFRTAGVASDVAASTLVGAANVFGTMIASSLMDKKGRKSLLMTSFSGMAVSMLLLSLSFTWKVLAPYSGPLAVIGTVFALAAFYTRQFAEKFLDIKPPLLQLLISFWQDESEHVRMAARSLFHCEHVLFLIHY